MSYHYGSTGGDMSEDIEVTQVEATLVQQAAPAMTPEALARRYKDLAELLQRNVLVDGSDYGVIPGTGDKPTLYKAGAEKLAAFFGLSIDMELVDKVEDWDGGFFYYRYKATATDKYGRSASGEGSANSREAKYRWRNIKEREYDPEVHGPARKIQKRGKYGTYYVYQVENKEPFDLVNTLQKMAQKRAYVQAVLLAVGASAFFTQDVEDLAAAGVIEEREPQPAPAAKPKREAKPKPAGPDSPVSPDKVRELGAMLKAIGITDKALGKALITLVIERHYKDTKDLTMGEADRVISYIEQLDNTLSAAGVPDDNRLAYLSAVLESGELPPTDAEALSQDYQAFANMGEIGGEGA